MSTIPVRHYGVQLKLECGHGGLLCDLHQAEGVRKLLRPRWRWFCRTCDDKSASMTWHRL